MGIVVAYWVFSWEQMILWMLSIRLIYLQSLKHTRHMMRNFEHFIKCRDKSGKRAFGGLSVYIKRKLSEGVSYVPTENKNAVWCKLDRTYFNLQNDIYIG